MPKVIDDAEERIFQAVVELISQQGLENTSMRKIAARSDLAVGTLYNYFNDKEELICHVIDKSWQGTFSKLDKIIKAEEKEDRAKMEEFVDTLYDEIMSRRLVGRDLLRNNIINQEEIDRLNKELRSRFRKLFESLNMPEHKSGKNLDEDRLASTIISTIITMADKYNHPEEDKIFISGVLHNFFNFED